MALQGNNTASAMTTHHSFYIADYVVFGVSVVISIGIGIYHALAGDRQRTTTEYLVAGRSMKYLPVAISLTASFESSTMMLGLPAEVYVYGIQWWLTTVGFLLAQMLSVIIVVPLFHPLRITSAYEYLQLRFNSTAVRLLGSFMGIIGTVWFQGIVLFGPAIALEGVTGFPQWGSIFIIAFVGIVYTSIGGLKAVVWTDVFQSLVMYAGMFAVLIKGTLDVGGASTVWNIAGQGGRLNFFNFDPDPTVRHTFWNLAFGSFIRGFIFAFSQPAVQRISATSTQREARMVLLIMAPCFFLSLTMGCYQGIVAFAYYQTKGCDPLAAKTIHDPNQVIPYTVMDIFHSLPGMPGLFLASLFSASLSTLSSGLNSLSALAWADFIKPRIREVSEFKATVIAKACVVVFGLIACGVSVLVSQIGGPLTQITASMMAASSGPLTGLFFMGCFCPWVNAKGALFGGLISLAFSTWISLGSAFYPGHKTPWLPLASTDNCPANHSASFFSNTTSSVMGASSQAITSAILNGSHYENDVVNGFQFDGLDLYSTVAASGLESTTVLAAPENKPQGVEVMYTLSYQLLSPIGVFVTIILGCVISIVTGGNKEGEVHPRYLISFCDHLCCFLPEAVRKLFRCGEDYSSVKDLPPVHDLSLHKELTIADPSKEPDKGTDPRGLSSTTLDTDLAESLPGSDVTPGNTNQRSAAEGSQNGFASMSRLRNDGNDDNVNNATPDDVEERQMEEEWKEGKEKSAHSSLSASMR